MSKEPRHGYQEPDPTGYPGPYPNPKDPQPCCPKCGQPLAEPNKCKCGWMKELVAAVGEAIGEAKFGQ